MLNAALAVMVCSGILFAQEGGYKAENSETKAQEKTEQKAAVKKITGKVVMVDGLINLLIIKTNKMEDTLTVDTGAKIMQGMKTIQLSDLAMGAQATVSWKMMNGKKTAIKIVEKAAAAAKK